MKYLIDECELVDFRPVVKEQALLEYLAINHKDAPIKGNILLKVEDGYIMTKTYDSVNMRYIIEFEKREK